jgi:hypothetical protein
MADTAMQLKAMQLPERYFYILHIPKTGLEMARNHPATHPNSLRMASISMLTRAAACSMEPGAIRLSTHWFAAPATA